MLLERYIALLTDINSSIKSFDEELINIVTPEHIQKFKPSVNLINDIRNYILKRCEESIVVLNVENAYHNHKLADSESVIKKILSSIKHNQLQWREAFQNNVSYHEASVSYLIDHIITYQKVLESRLNRLRQFKSAKWKSGNEVPGANVTALLYVKKTSDSMVIEYLEDAIYHVEDKAWFVANKPLDGDISIIEWTIVTKPIEN